MRASGALALAFGVAVAFAGCTSGGAASGTTSTVIVTVPAQPTATSGSGSTGRPATTTAATPGPVIDASGHGFTTFVSPSGNIVCGGLIDGGNASVRCDITQKNWTMPKPAGCDFDWGSTLTLDTKAQGGCVSDAMLSTQPLGTESTWWLGKPGAQPVTVQGVQALALAYGATMVIGDIRCASATDGMHCTNVTTKAGFDLAREAYVLR